MALFEYGGSGTITRMLTKLHTLLGDYLKADQLGSAVDDALAQAKESGEFDGADGADGDDGVSVVSVEQTTTSTADGGENIITVTLSNGNKATFKVKNGSKGSKGDTGETGPEGPQGEQGEKGDPGADGAAGTSVTVSNVTESTADGGSNVVKFSDGKSVTIKNGSKGSKGDKGDTGDTGPQGPAGANGSDYVLTETDKQAIADLAAALVDVSGKLDKSGGTMTGALVAQNNTNYTTKQVRNIITINKGDAFPSGANGDLCFVRKV